jgi:hypothetical protein
MLSFFIILVIFECSILLTIVFFCSIKKALFNLEQLNDHYVISLHLYHIVFQ